MRKVFGADRESTAGGHEGEVRRVLRTSRWTGTAYLHVVGSVPLPGVCSAYRTTHPRRWISDNKNLITLASVQFRRGARKYEIPFKSASLSILRSMHWVMA